MKYSSERERLPSKGIKDPAHIGAHIVPAVNLTAKLVTRVPGLPSRGRAHLKLVFVQVAENVERSLIFEKQLLGCRHIISGGPSLRPFGCSISWQFLRIRPSKFQRHLQRVKIVGFECARFVNFQPQSCKQPCVLAYIKTIILISTRSSQHPPVYTTLTFQVQGLRTHKDSCAD